MKSCVGVLALILSVLSSAWDTADAQSIYAYHDFAEKWSEVGVPYKPLTLITCYGLFARNDDKYDFRQIDPATCRRVARSLPPRSVVCLDVEQFDFGRDWDAATEQFLIAHDNYRAANPSLQIGFYRHLPFRNYWAPVRYRKSDKSSAGHSQLAAAMHNWQLKNRKHLTQHHEGVSVGPHGLADHVNVIMPSLYTMYPDQQGWQYYAEENLREALQYKKPVIVWLWPVYHPSGTFKDYRYLGDDYIRMQWRTIQRFNVEGVVFFEAHTERVPPSFFKLIASLARTDRSHIPDPRKTVSSAGPLPRAKHPRRSPATAPISPWQPRSAFDRQAAHQTPAARLRNASFSLPYPGSPATAP